MEDRRKYFRRYPGMKGSLLWKYVLLLPFLLYLTVILYGGIVQGFIGSLGYIPALGQERITLDHYREVLSSDVFRRSFLFTLKFALVSATSSVILGLLTALYLRSRPGNGIITSVLRIPIIIPHIVAALYTVLLFSDTGIMARIFRITGTDGFKGIVGSAGGAGIILSYIWKSTPYVALTVFTFLKGISGDLERTSMNLGGGRIYTFFRITLPQLRTELITTFIILFCYAFGSYETPAVLGPTFPKALALTAHQEFMDPLMTHRPVAMVYNMIQILTGIIISACLIMLLGRRNPMGGEN